MSKEKFDELVNDVMSINAHSAEVMDKICSSKNDLSQTEFVTIMSRLLSVYINGIICQHVLFPEDEEDDQKLIDILSLSVKKLAPKLREDRNRLMDKAT